MVAVPIPHQPGEVPVSQARDQLGQLVDRAYHASQVVFLTRRGRRVAAIVPASDVDHLDVARRSAMAEAVANFNAWVPESEFHTALEAERAATAEERAGA